MDKITLRKIMKERRAALSLYDRKKEEEQALEQLFALPAFQAAKTVFLYASYGSEFPTAPIAEAAIAMGKQVAYPKVWGKTLRFYKDAPLAAGYKGIPEPQGGEEVTPAAGDFLLVPALALSKEGGRLGYGGGFYDRYIVALSSRPYCCGIGYSCQWVEDLPMEEWDQNLDNCVGIVNFS